VVHDELAAPLEEIGKGLLAGRRVEHVVLLDPDPRQCASLATQLIAQARELFLLGQELGSCLGPLLAGYDLVICHDISFRYGGSLFGMRRAVQRFAPFRRAASSAIRSTLYPQPASMPSRCSGASRPIARCVKLRRVPFPS